MATTPRPRVEDLPAEEPEVLERLTSSSNTQREIHFKTFAEALQTLPVINFGVRDESISEADRAKVQEITEKLEVMRGFLTSGTREFPSDASEYPGRVRELRAELLNSTGQSYEDLRLAIALEAGAPSLVVSPEARREQSIEAVREAGNSDALFYSEANSQVASQRINDPQFIENLAAQYPGLSRNEVQAEYAYGVSQYGLNLNVEAMEPAADRVQMLTRGRELFEQENFDGDPASRWTLQQFSTNPVGEPWMALQQKDEAGDVQRTFTGTRSEMETLISDNKLNVTELSPITEGQYYRQALGSMGLEPEIRQEEGFGVSV